MSAPWLQDLFAYASALKANENQYWIWKLKSNVQTDNVLLKNITLLKQLLLLGDLEQKGLVRAADHFRMRN